MRVVALISGGKDSCFNMMHCVAMGHEIVGLANLYPIQRGETDSYMYQTVGSEAIEVYSQAMQLPLFRREIKGSSIEIDLHYQKNIEDEVEDLYCLLKSVQGEIEYEAVSCGAILSDYQRIRVENVCSRLGLVSLSYLWQQNQENLLQDMINSKLNAVLIKTAALGLVPNHHLGKSLEEMQGHLLMLNSKYGSHICGEGGEYETFTLDCPLFKKRIVIDESDVITHSDDGVTSVAYLHLKSLHVEDKHEQTFDFSGLVPKTLGCDQIVTDGKLECTAPTSTGSQRRTGSTKQDSDQSPLLMTCVVDEYMSVNNLIGVCEGSDEKDVVGCAEKVFHKLTEILTHHRHSPSDILFVFLSLTNISHFTLINSVYKTLFDSNPPVRVCVCSHVGAGGAEDDEEYRILLQIDCISRRNPPPDLKTMHVQGISHWAPANIGPYSQCKVIDGLCLVAGQIGLVPGTMTLVGGGVEPEAVLSLSHVQSILTAMDPQLNLASTAHCVCYVTDLSSLNVVQSVWSKAVKGDEDLLRKVVYVLVDVLPRHASVEWEVVAHRPSANPLQPIYPTSVLFNCWIDYSRPFNVFLDNFLLSKRNQSDLPLHVRVFYPKEILSLCEIPEIHEELSLTYNHDIGLAWTAVEAVFEHNNPIPICGAAVGLFVKNNINE